MEILQISKIKFSWTISINVVKKELKPVVEVSRCLKEGEDTTCAMTVIIILLFLFNYFVVVFNLNFNFAIKLFHERAYYRFIFLNLCC